MSDPVTNVEIEDVLSSIRRLVSEDARVRPLTGKASDRASERSRPLADEIAPTREAPGKLVLTPALRVTESETAPQDQDDTADDLSGDDAAQDSGAAAEADQQDQVDAAPISDSDVPDSAAHEVVAEPSPPHEDAQQQAVEEMPEDAVQSVDALPWEDHHEAHHEDYHEDLQGDYQAKEDHNETHSDTLLLDEAVSVEDAGEADIWPEDPGLDPVETPQAAATPLGDVAGEYASASGGFVFSSVRDGAEHGTIAQEDMAQDTIAQADAADAFSETDPADSLFADDETILDEEMLRELVTEIVRQELQGALGERITRNVRKLVRREIHRALTSHELE